MYGSKTTKMDKDIERYDWIYLIKDVGWGPIRLTNLQGWITIEQKIWTVW